MKFRPDQLRALSIETPHEMPILAPMPRDPNAPEPKVVTTPDELAEAMGWPPLNDEDRERIQREWFHGAPVFVQLPSEEPDVLPGDRTPPVAVVDEVDEWSDPSMFIAADPDWEHIPRDEVMRRLAGVAPIVVMDCGCRRDFGVMTWCDRHRPTVVLYKHRALGPTRPNETLPCGCVEMPGATLLCAEHRETGPPCRGNPLDDIRKCAEVMRKDGSPAVVICTRCLGPASVFRMTDRGPVHVVCPGSDKR